MRVLLPPITHFAIGIPAILLRARRTEDADLPAAALRAPELWYEVRAERAVVRSKSVAKRQQVKNCHVPAARLDAVAPNPVAACNGLRDCVGMSPHGNRGRTSRLGRQAE